LLSEEFINRESIIISRQLQGGPEKITVKTIDSQHNSIFSEPRCIFENPKIF